MDHLACFLPGLLALGHSAGADPDGSQGHLELAKRLAHTCYNFYNQSKSGMAPETVVFDMSMEDNDKVAAVSLHTRATCHHYAIATPSRPRRPHAPTPLATTTLTPRPRLKSPHAQRPKKKQRKSKRKVFDVGPPEFMRLIRDVDSLLRPETVESLFYLWRVTGDTMYQDWGWGTSSGRLKPCVASRPPRTMDHAPPTTPANHHAPTRRYIRGH